MDDCSWVISFTKRRDFPTALLDQVNAMLEEHEAKTEVA
jgi:hypothetical protein